MKAEVGKMFGDLSGAGEINGWVNRRGGNVWWLEPTRVKVLVVVADAGEIFGGCNRRGEIFGGCNRRGRNFWRG